MVQELLPVVWLGIYEVPVFQMDVYTGYREMRDATKPDEFCDCILDAKMPSEQVDRLKFA
jgi:hypothetical protein